MSRLPKVLNGDRIFDAVAVPMLSVAQAVLLSVAAFATREAFQALHGGVPLHIATVIKLVGAALGVAGLDVLRRVCAERLGQSYANALRIALYRHLAGMPKSALDQRRLGALSLRFVGDLAAARYWFGVGLPNVASAAVILPGAALVLWVLDPRIAVIGYLALGITLGLMILTAFGFETLHMNLRSRRARIAIDMMERIAIAPILDLMGRTQLELDALDARGHDLRVDATRRAWRAGSLAAVPQIGLAVAGAATLWYAAQSGAVPGTVAAVLAIFGILTLPLRDVALSWDQFNSWRIARQKALNLLAQDSRLRNPVATGQPVGVTAQGRFRGKEVALTIPAGQAVWLRGGHACDRSALAILLAGLDEACDLHVGYGTARAGLPRIHFIGETPVALQGSLRRTLTLGISPRPSGSIIVKIARDFGLHDLVRQGRRSLKNRIAEAARGVSASDSVRIDLVRVALARPELVVIDTARLSAEPDQAVLLELLRRYVDGTILVVDQEDSNDLQFRIQPMEFGKIGSLR